VERSSDRERLKRVRWSSGAVAALLLVASACAAGGQDNALDASRRPGVTPPLGAPGTVILTDPDLAGAARSGVSLRVGGFLEFVLGHDGYRRDGTPAFPTVTVASAGSLSQAPSPASVLAVVPNPRGTQCPGGKACTWITTRSGGVGAAEVEGAAGLVCSDPHGSTCAAVSAAIFAIHVHAT
jgi:hypothetical protein